MVSYEKHHKHCGRCRVSTLHYRKATNHVLHLLLTVMLCGWWAPTWAMISLKIGGWRCETCGYRRNLLLQLAVLVVCGVGFLWFSSMLLPRRVDSPPPSPGNAPQVGRAEPQQVGSATLSAHGETAHDEVAEIIPTADVESMPEQPATSTTPPPIEAAEANPLADTPQPEPEPEPIVQPEGDFRLWTDETGEHTTEAEFVSYGMGTVTLRKKDGQAVKLPMERLSEVDQAWVREHIGKH